MRKDDLTKKRYYEPDEDSVVNGLMLILRIEGPPGKECQETKETTNGKLAGNTLMVSKTIENQDTGESHV